MVGMLHLNSVSAILRSSIISRAERYEIMKMGQAANCFKQLFEMFKVIIKLWRRSMIWY